MKHKILNKSLEITKVRTETANKSWGLEETEWYTLRSEVVLSIESIRFNDRSVMVQNVCEMPVMEE